MCENNIFEVKKVDRHIYVIDNVMTDRECEDIIEHINSNIGQDTDNNNIVRVFVTKLQSDCENDLILHTKIKIICNKIFRSIMHVNPLIEINGDTSYNLNKIYSFTSLHADEEHATVDNFIDNKIRTLSLIINLNDDYTGGIFHFPKHNIKYKLNKGGAILFPPFWTHPHEITDISSTCYTITTWGTEKLIRHI
jgi:hypothetical protein